jgi:hypothetical protein
MMPTVVNSKGVYLSLLILHFYYSKLYHFGAPNKTNIGNALNEYNIGNTRTAF